MEERICETDVLIVEIKTNGVIDGESEDGDCDE